MSLILRKQCQPLLDNVGLKELHVEAVDRGMYIKGTCGKTVLTVGGINFNSRTVTKAEVEYAVELFGTFMAKHGKALKKYVAKKKEIYDLKEPLPEDFGGLAGYNRNMFTKNMVIKGKAYSFNIAKNSPTASPTISIGQVDLEVFRELATKVEGIISEAQTYYKAREDYQNILAEDRKLQSEIAKCNI